VPRMSKPPSKPMPPLDPRTTGVNGPAAEVLTLAEAAAYLRLSEADVSSAVHAQGLPGRLVGGQWRFLKAAIQQWLTEGALPSETRKAALLAAAGAFQDDPDLLSICAEAYRRRGRPITEDGSYNVLQGLEPGQ
jgi:excisionase family DNA binding protein